VAVPIDGAGFAGTKILTESSIDYVNNFFTVCREWFETTILMSSDVITILPETKTGDPT